MTDEDDHALAGRLATEAGELLVELRAERVRGRRPPVAGHGRGRHRAPTTSSSRRLARGPARRRRALRGGPRRRSRLTANRVWIVDPLDGTNEFGEAGRPDWAVHVALCDRRPLGRRRGRAARGRRDVRHRPGAGRCRRRARPAAAHRHQPLPRAPRRRRRRAGARRRRRAAGLGRRQGDGRGRSGEADIYAHDGGMYEWDSAAPAAVAAAAGLHVSRIDGSPLVYNNPDPWLPDLLVVPARAGADAGACTRCGAEGHPLRGRRRGGHRLAAPAAPPQRVDGADARRVPVDPGRSWRPTSTVRAVVVTGSPPAFCVGGDREALAGHAERGGYDAGLPAEPAQPGLRRAAGAGPRLRLALRRCACR